MYKLIEIETSNGVVKSVLRTADNAYIPFDEANTDYQAYLKYIAEGGTVLPADEQGSN